MKELLEWYAVLSTGAVVVACRLMRERNWMADKCIHLCAEMSVQQHIAEMPAPHVCRFDSGCGSVSVDGALMMVCPEPRCWNYRVVEQVGKSQETL